MEMVQISETPLTVSEETPCEDSQNKHSSAPWSWMLNFLNFQGINLYCLSQLVYFFMVAKQNEVDLLPPFYK